MITQDPATRAQVSSRIMEIVAETAPAEDRKLILSFAPVILSEAPDRILFLLPPEMRREYRPLLAEWFVRRHADRLVET